MWWWCRTNLAKKGTVLLGQVKETASRRAELKEEKGARMRGGVCMWGGLKCICWARRNKSRQRRQTEDEKRDVFEQDVARRKVTRILDPLHRLLVLWDTLRCRILQHTEGESQAMNYSALDYILIEHDTECSIKISLSVSLHAISPWTVIMKQLGNVVSMVQIEGIVLGHADLLNFSSSFWFHTISQLQNLFEYLVDQTCIMGRN